MPFTLEERGTAERLHLVDARAFRDDGDAAFAARRDDGSCVFLEGTDHSTLLCGIHRVAGHHALPVACRMFPRVALHDGRGWTITLSHFCPTAASLLFEGADPVTIVESPRSLTDVGPLDGLDASGAIPPLLRDGVLMDLESFSEWEAQAIRVLTSEADTPETAIARLQSITDEVARWTPASGDLIDAVHAAFQTPRDTGGRPARDRDSRAIQRWLAAHLFGNWIAYQGRGLRTIVRYVRACLDLFTVELARDGNALEAIRRSDFLIVHESDSQHLATALDALVRRQRV